MCADNCKYPLHMDMPEPATRTLVFYRSGWFQVAEPGCLTFRDTPTMHVCEKCFVVAGLGAVFPLARKKEMA